MTIRLMELKTNNKHKEFILKQSTSEKIIHWESLPDIEAIRVYLKHHPFPLDNCYSEQEFIEDASCASGYIHLWVEKEQTAEFICQLCSELI